jgi:hypothetical protein
MSIGWWWLYGRSRQQEQVLPPEEIERFYKMMGYGCTCWACRKGYVPYQQRGQEESKE